MKCIWIETHDLPDGSVGFACEGALCFCVVKRRDGKFDWCVWRSPRKASRDPYEAFGEAETLDEGKRKIRDAIEDLTKVPPRGPAKAAPGGARGPE